MSISYLNDNEINPGEYHLFCDAYLANGHANTADKALKFLVEHVKMLSDDEYKDTTCTITTKIQHA